MSNLTVVGKEACPRSSGCDGCIDTQTKRAMDRDAWGHRLAGDGVKLECGPIFRSSRSCSPDCSQHLPACCCLRSHTTPTVVRPSISSLVVYQSPSSFLRHPQKECARTIHAPTIRNQPLKLLDVSASSFGEGASTRGDAVPVSRHQETPLACEIPKLFCHVF